MVRCEPDSSCAIHSMAASVSQQAGCAATTVPQVLVTSIDSTNGTGPVTLAYSVTTTQLCTVPDPTRIQVHKAAVKTKT